MAEKREQIIILGLSHKVCCLLPSPSYCNMVYALRLTRSHFSLSLLLDISTREAPSRRERGTRAIQIQMTEDKLRFTVPSPPLP